MYLPFVAGAQHPLHGLPECLEYDQRHLESDAGHLVGADHARVTHAHPRGQQGAALLAAAVAVVASGRPVDARRLVDSIAHIANDPALADQLSRLPGLTGASPADAARALGHGIAAEEAVPAALQAFCTHPDDYRGAVTYAVAMGGDTDTIAAMAGGLGGARVGRGGIPETLVARLEAGERLAALGDRLCQGHVASQSGLRPISARPRARVSRPE